MKKKLLFLLILPIPLLGSAQTTLDELLKKIGDVPAVKAINDVRVHLQDNSPATVPKHLVSDYTFKNLIKNDFATINGIDNTATVGKFAALNINQSTSAFTFTPYSYAAPDLVNYNYKNIYSVDFNGTVDKTGLFDLKNWRTVTLGLSKTHIFSTVYSYDGGGQSARLKSLSKVANDKYSQLYRDVEIKFLENYLRTQDNKVDDLNHAEFEPGDDADAPYAGLKKAYLDSVSKYEQLLTKAGWTKKSFFWWKAAISPLAFDNANYIVQGDTATYNSPIVKAYYTPSATFTINRFEAWNKGLNLYLTAFIQGVYKDAFTDVGNPAEWDKFMHLTDSAVIKSNTQSVYTSPSSAIRRQVLFNGGFEGILLAPAPGPVGFGADIYYSVNEIISNKPGYETGYLSNAQFGLIISFKDKTGATTINLEPYYQSKRYIDYVLPSAHLWGMKFSIPIGRLY